MSTNTRLAPVTGRDLVAQIAAQIGSSLVATWWHFCTWWTGSTVFALVESFPSERVRTRLLHMVESENTRLVGLSIDIVYI